MRDDKASPYPDKHRWRFYHSELAEEGSDVCLDEDESHHIQVLRLKPEETVEITDGNGLLAEARLLEIQKRQARLQILNVCRTLPSPGGISVFVGKARTSAIEEALESASQLGVSRFVVFSSEKSRNRQQLKTDRLQKIARESARISKGVFLTKVDCLPEKEGLDALQQELENTIRLQREQKTHAQISVCDESPLHEHLAPHLHLLNRLRQGPSLTFESIIIGPEGGLTTQERQALLHWATLAEADLQFVSLGRSILTVPNAVRCAAALACAVHETKPHSTPFEQKAIAGTSGKQPK